MGGQEIADCPDGDGGGFFFGEVVDTGADVGEGDRFYSVLRRQPERIAIGIRQQFFFAVMAAVPDRAYGVDDIFGGQVAAGGDDGFAGGAAALFGADRAAFFQDRGAAGTMDGAVYAAAAEQGAIGGIDDGIDFHFCNVALEEVDAGGHVNEYSNRTRVRYSAVMNRI